MKQRIVITTVALVVAIGAGLVIAGNGGRRLDQPSGRSAIPSPSPAPAPNPIQIESMERQIYSPSTITMTRTVEVADGYAASVRSYTSDGLTEYMYWAQPTGTEPRGGWPTIVLVHGYIDPQAYNTVKDAYIPWISAWAKAGFVVVQPDLRGNGASHGSAVSGHWDPDYTYDVMNLIASLRADQQINATRIGVAGHSMGGHIALNVAVIDPKVKATLLVNGVVGSMYDLFYNWPNSPAPHDQPAAAVTAELSGLIARYGTPKSNPPFWDRASAINYVSQIRGPVQIDADTGDSVVPYAFSQELDIALRRAHKNVSLYMYPGNDHQLASPSDLPLFIKRSTAFWQQWLR